jgi:vitamin B12/bleomycin/antimicrobial peptide transport system ATP-binding/permease protein
MDMERRRRGRWLRDFWALAKPYWISDEKGSAWAHLVVIFAGKSCFVYLNVIMNTWYKEFWDAGANADRVAFFI